MPLLRSLLCLLLLTISQPAKAMFPEEQPERHAPKLVQLDPRWDLESLRGKLPREITIFDRQTPISDELLAKLNPEWQKLSHILPLDEKNELIGRSHWYPGGDDNDHIARCIYAQAIAMGADPSTNLSDDTVLSYAILQNDYELAKYVLAKLNKEQRKSEQEAVIDAKSVQIAELLLAGDVPLPENIIDKCITYNRPLELMKFYLQKGANPNGCLDDSLSPLHHCTFYHSHLVFVPLLLEAGADINLKNRYGQTILHEALDRNNTEFCECVVDYFLKKEEAVTIFLGCLKKKLPQFYNEAKHLRPALVKDFSPLLRLKKALEISNDSGETAYGISRLEMLNPANCSYAKLRQLRNKSTPFINHDIE